MAEEPRIETPVTVAENKLAGRVSVWIGIATTVITIVLTVWNAHTKSVIDERDEALKTTSVELEVTKARLERLKWVFDRYPDLVNPDQRKRVFMTNLIQLALNKPEADQLFAGFRASTDTVLSNVAQKVIANQQNEPISALVSQLDAGSAGIRIAAFNALVKNYASTPQAIDQVLKMYDPNAIKNFSLNGIINGLYFLAGTDPAIWSAGEVTLAANALTLLNASAPGQKTKDAIDVFNTHLKLIRKARG